MSAWRACVSIQNCLFVLCGPRSLTDVNFHYLPDLGHLGASPHMVAVEVGRLDVWTNSFLGEAEDLGLLLG